MFNDSGDNEKIKELFRRSTSSLALLNSYFSLTGKFKNTF